MAKSRIDEALAALKAAGNDGFGARREVLERLGLEAIRRLITISACRGREGRCAMCCG